MFKFSLIFGHKLFWLLLVNSVFAFFVYFQQFPINYMPGGDRVWSQLILDYAPCVKDEFFCFMEPYETYTKPVFIWLSTLIYVYFKPLLNISPLESIVLLSNLSMAMIATLLQIQVMRSIKINSYISFFVSFFFFWSSSTVWGAHLTWSYAQISALGVLLTLESFYQYANYYSKENQIKIINHFFYATLISFLSLFTIFIHIGSLPYIFLIFFLAVFLIFFLKFNWTSKVNSEILVFFNKSFYSFVFFLFFLIVLPFFILFLENIFTFFQAINLSSFLINNKIYSTWAFLFTLSFLFFLILYKKYKILDLSFEDNCIKNLFFDSTIKVTIVGIYLSSLVGLIYFFSDYGSGYIYEYLLNVARNSSASKNFTSDIDLLPFFYLSIFFYFLFAEWPTLLFFLIFLPFIKINFFKLNLTRPGLILTFLYFFFFFLSFLGLSFSGFSKLLRTIYPTYLPLIYLLSIIFLLVVKMLNDSLPLNKKKFSIYILISIFLISYSFNSINIISCTQSYRNGLPKFIQSNIDPNLSSSKILGIHNDDTWLIHKNSYFQYFTGFTEISSKSYSSYSEVMKKAKANDYLLVSKLNIDPQKDGWVLINNYIYRNCDCSYADIWINEFITMKYLLIKFGMQSTIERYKNNDRMFVFRYIREPKKLYLYKMSNNYHVKE